MSVRYQMATPGKKTRNAGPEKSSEHMHEVEEPKIVRHDSRDHHRDGGQRPLEIMPSDEALRCLDGGDCHATAILPWGRIHRNAVKLAKIARITTLVASLEVANERGLNRFGKEARKFLVR